MQLKTVEDSTIVECSFTIDDDEELIGYELTINITEHTAKNEIWREVKKCNVYPIIMPKYSPDYIKLSYFNEIIILANESISIIEISSIVLVILSIFFTFV